LFIYKIIFYNSLFNDLVANQMKLYLQGKIPKAKKYEEIFNDYFMDQI